MSNFILDASALLAYLHDEPGADEVENALNQGSYISIINWAEVLSKIADLGEDPQEIVQHFEEEGLLGSSLDILEFTKEDALTVARLRPVTRSFGLSFGDRACIALGQRLNLPILTSDRSWTNLNLNIQINLIR